MKGRDDLYFSESTEIEDFFPKARIQKYKTQGSDAIKTDWLEMFH